MYDVCDLRDACHIRGVRDVHYVCDECIVRYVCDFLMYVTYAMLVDVHVE